MNVEEYKINLMTSVIPTLEERLEKVNAVIVEFGLKGQGLSQDEWLELKRQLIDNYNDTGISAYATRNRIINRLIQTRLEVLPIENKYFIKVEFGDELNWNLRKETYKIIKEVDSNSFMVMRLDKYLETKKEGKETFDKKDIIKIRRGLNNIFYNKRENYMYFLSDSPTSFYDYRIK